MSTEIQLTEGNAIAHSQTNSDLMAVIARAASDANVDVGKMERLMALMERREAQDRQQLFSAALSRIQAVAPQITQHGRTDKARFAKLEDIDTSMRPLMAAEGLALSFDTSFVDGRVLMTARLSHSGGHFEEKTLALPTDTGPGRNPIQAMGSTVSYGRRYLTKMWFNIVEVAEDNDGNGARKSISQKQADELNDLLTEIGGDEKARFLRWAGVAKVADVPVDKFDRGIAALLKKRSGV